MSVDVPSSPYAAVPPAGTPEDGLGYSRHYAQRIRDMGKSSKDSWIKRLWNHMFQKKEKNLKEESEDNNGMLPPINREGSLVSIQQTSPKTPSSASRLPSRDSNNNGKGRQSSNSAPQTITNGRQKNVGRDGKVKVLPVELANSPYLAPKERANYKVDRSGRPVNNGGQKDPQRDKKGRDGQLYVRKPAHPYLSQHQEVWKPRITRAPNMIKLEKRAKATTEKAMKDAKIFTCIAPYPVDAYVRYSLRKRGWVEKFGPKANASSKNSNSGKLECEDEEDFEAICGQEVPAPWEEDHGIYAIMSRVARHYPPKFIWGGRNVNSLILKSDVMVNHFPKARHFSSKVLLAQSLRELPWQNDGDPNDFFPRCYILGEDDKEDIIEDFRLTACMSLLKWVLRTYIRSSRHRGNHATITSLARENTKYEEVMSSKDCEPQNNSNRSIFDDIVTPEPDTQTDIDRHVTFTSPTPDAVDLQRESSAVGDPVTMTTGDESLPEDYESLICADEVTTTTTDGKESPVQREGAASAKQRTNTEKVGPVVPDLKTNKVKKGAEVPTKAVDWAISHLQRYIKSRKNEDLDLKYDLDGKNPDGPEDSVFRKRGLSQPQWKQLLTWYYEVSQNGGVVSVTESKLREAEDTLRAVREIWPQYEIDGKRNIWIVKPGDKSKAIGIEFTDKLDDILKYVNNSTIQGTYVIQKYIERPLLIYKCKFDIRQWFLVTEWNPLTIWFYKECYLRICSQEYQYDSMHESVHLSNVAVQQNYLNGKRSDKLPDNNYMTSSDFQEYLSETGAGNAWKEIIYPGMKRAIVNTLIATQDVNETRRNAFELYGADFMMSENYQPWLIEINASPGMAPSSVEKVRLCSTVIEDTIKVVVDRKENSSCSTGGFELVLRDNPIPATKCVETKFVLEGQRIRRPDLQRYTMLDQKNTKAEMERERKERLKAEKQHQQEEEAKRAELREKEAESEEKGAELGEKGAESGEKGAESEGKEAEKTGVGSLDKEAGLEDSREEKDQENVNISDDSKEEEVINKPEEGDTQEAKTTEEEGKAVEESNKEDGGDGKKSSKSKDKVVEKKEDGKKDGGKNGSKKDGEKGKSKDNGKKDGKKK